MSEPKDNNMGNSEIPLPILEKMMSLDGEEWLSLVQDFSKTKMPNFKCPMCSNEDFITMKKFSEESYIGIPGAPRNKNINVMRFCYSLVCDNCGFTALMDYEPLSQFYAERERGQ